MSESVNECVCVCLGGRGGGERERGVEVRVCVSVMQLTWRTPVNLLYVYMYILYSICMRSRPKSNRLERTVLSCSDIMLCVHGA